MGFVVNLNKPYQITSHRAVSKVKKILKAKKAGHAGTLDPIAEGVLLICIDEATKIARFLTGLEKEYIATIRLGQKTDTYDSEGTVIESHDPSAVGISEVEAAVVQFTGLIEQVPPMYSAVKSQGTPLYKLARKGKVIERKPRTVNIIGLEILEYRNPMLKVKVICSKGTYIRSLAHDIGDQLGVGAHLDRLVRTRVGDFTIEDSVSMEPEEIMNGLIAMDASLGDMKEMRLKDESALKIRNGVPILFADENIINFESIIVCDETEYFRIKDESGELFAIGKVRDSYVRTERVFLTKPKEEF